VNDSARVGLPLATSVANWDDDDGNADGVVPVVLNNLSSAALGVFGMIV
jgi:hypothetical protein